MVGSLKGVAIAPRPAAIAGGFVLVPVASLMAAWRSCRGRPGGPGDFRAWLACREMLARRARIGIDRAPTYDEPELASLLGISARRARASVRRLVAAGLVRWSGLAIEFPEPPAGDAGTAGEVLADSIGSGRGSLAIPRRLLRSLARGARPALLATALGALLRCLSRRRAGFDGRGRLKASWIARAFGVDSRAVKAARAELVALGWLMPEASGQAALNRWGRAYRIDLAWARPGPPAGALSPPPPAGSGALSPPPDLHQDPLAGIGKNQDPAPGGPAGVEVRRIEGGQKPASGPAEAGRRSGPPAGGPSPRLADVRPEDLADAGRLLELHRQAMGRGLVGPSEADRLKFAAAAVHARAVGKNPCGLFARIVSKGWWGLATLGEEERAARWLREPARGGPAGRSATAARPVQERGAESLGRLGEVLGRLGIGADRPVRMMIGPEAGGGLAGAPIVGGPGRGSDPGRAGGGGGGGAVSAERGGVGSPEEASMLARLARLMGRGEGDR